MKDGRCILVTGISRGIGRSLVNILSQNPQVYIIGITRSENVVQELKQKWGERHLFRAVNLSDESAMRALMEEVQSQFGQLDGLINNAGFLLQKDFLSMERKDLEAMMEVNYTIPYLLTQCFLPLLEKGKLKHVINISSMGGVTGTQKFPGLSGYSSSKGALSCLSECLGEELKDRGIVVNALALGAVQTEMLEEAFPGYRAPVSPDAMAEFIVNFLFNSGSYINGKVIPVSLSTP